MVRKCFIPLVVAVSLGVALLSACEGADGSTAEGTAGGKASAGTNGQDFQGSFVQGTAKENEAEPGTGDFVTEVEPNKPDVHTWVGLTAGKAGDVAPIVLNGAGFPLYRFDKDSASPSKSTCVGECEKLWPPVLIDPDGKIFVDGVEEDAVDTVEREDGTLQVTLGGWPLYRFSQDDEPGIAKGNDFAEWDGVAPDGGKSVDSNPAFQEDPEDVEETDEPEDKRDADEATDLPIGQVELFEDAGVLDKPIETVKSRHLDEGDCLNVRYPEVASAVRTRQPITVWEGKDCSGESLGIEENIADLSKRNFDNRIVSIFIPVA